MSVEELLDCVQSHVGVEGKEWHLKRTNWCGEAAATLDDLQADLHSAGLTNNELLLLESGTILAKGHIRLHISLCGKEPRPVSSGDGDAVTFPPDPEWGPVVGVEDLYQDSRLLALDSIVMPGAASLRELYVGDSIVPRSKVHGMVTVSSPLQQPCRSVCLRFLLSGIKSTYWSVFVCVKSAREECREYSAQPKIR